MKDYLNICYLNLYFFLLVLKKYINYANCDSINNKIFLNYKLISKRKKSIFFTKADFKYKTSKHSVSKFQKNFFLEIFITGKYSNSLTNYNLYNIYYKLMSNVYLNISYIKQKIFFSNINFFLYK